LGLLTNARFIQGVFDDKSDPRRFDRYGVDKFDPDENTDQLISSLPEWYAHGLRAITVSFQGGGPCYTIENQTIDNNPYGSDGKTLDPAYADRMDRIIKAADELGMIVIVSAFYFGQTDRLIDGDAIVNALKTFCKFIREGNYTNIIIEVAQEYNNPPYQNHPLINEPEGICHLMNIVREETSGIPLGASGTGGHVNEQVCKNSDVILIHGNECTPQQLYNLIRKTKSYADGKPVLLNEDSQCTGNMAISIDNNVSWSYYNNMTKQEPPTYWNITEGEDRFFAYRMAEYLGIDQEEISADDQFYFQGFEQHMVYEGKRWLRLASLYPEKIHKVEFYQNDKLYYTCYEEPFSVNFESTWRQGSIESVKGDCWKALIYMCNGDKKELIQYVK
jgi:hypothetical protein